MRKDLNQSKKAIHKVRKLFYPSAIKALNATAPLNSEGPIQEYNYDLQDLSVFDVDDHGDLHKPIPILDMNML